MFSSVLFSVVTVLLLGCPFFLFERRFAARPVVYRKVLARDFGAYMVGALLSIGSGATLKFLVAEFHVAELLQLVPPVPTWARIPLAVVGVDFGLYWMHRLIHTAALWRLHRWHHVPRQMYWLAGMRTINGRQIAESDQGPVIDLSQVASTQSGGNPWAIDPDGFRAGWSKVLVMDPNYAQSGNGFVLWFWASPNAFTSPLPFLTDPDGTPAQWVQHQVCVDGNVVNKWFWGTP